MKHHKTVTALLAAALFGACGDSGSEPDPGPELQCNIPTDQLFAGAAGRDAIPSLSHPEIDDVNASFMRDTDRVIGVVVNGEARAYPFGILWWHEVVNDTVGGVPVLVTYCPLTGSGIGFDPQVGTGLRDFGVSGLLYLTNLIMFDRENSSLWSQMGLVSQCGPDRGTDLERIAVVETDWINWRNLYPNTTVVTPNTGFGNRPYFQYPYGDYDEPANSFVDFLPPGVTWSNERLPKELVLGVIDGSAVTAYPLRDLEALGVNGVVNDVVGSTPVVVTSQSQWRTARAFDRRVGGQTLTFTLGPGGGPFAMTDAETGSSWNTLGLATSGPMAGEQLTPIADSFVAFWFAWSIFYPQIELFQ